MTILWNRDCCLDLDLDTGTAGPTDVFVETSTGHERRVWGSGGDRLVRALVV